MAQSLADLIDICIEVCQEAPRLIKVTPDTYLQETLAQKQVTDPNQIEFVQETLYCYLRYEKLVTKLVGGFFDLNSSSIVRSDRHRFEVLLLYAIWKFDQLGEEGFRSIILSQVPHKMCVLLEFFFSSENLDGWFTEICATYFDINYVQSTLVPAMKQRSPAVFRVLAELFRRDPSLAATSKFAKQTIANENQTEAASEGVEVGATPHEDESKQELDPAALAAQTLRETTSQFANFARTAATLPQPKVTIAEPFNLSQPRPNRRRAPLALPREEPASPFKAQPAPTAILNKVTLADLEEQREKLRQKTLEETKAKYASEANVPTVLERSRQAEQRIQERRRIAEEREKQAKAQEKRLQEMRHARLQEELEHAKSGGLAPIKMTAAAILREDALYRKLQEQALAELERYASELKDSSEHEQWKEEVARADSEKQKELIAQRKQELARAAEEAAAAVRRKQEEIRQQAAQQREERALLEEQRKRELQAELEQKRQLHEEVVALRENVPLRVKEIISRNASIAETLRRESEHAKRVVAAQRAEELAERKALIKQIQTMERIAAAKAKQPKQIDPTTTGVSGLLDEMSIAELRARLTELNRQREEEEQAKREQIQIARRLRQTRLEAIARNHVAIRAHMKEKVSMARAAVLVSRAQAVEEEAKRSKELGERIAERAKEREISKREAALELARRVRDSMEHSSLLHANSEALARARAHTLALAAERAEKRAAETKRMEEEKAEAIRRAAAWQRRLTRRRQALARRQTYRAYDEDLEKRREMAVQEMQQDQERRETIVRQLKSREETARAHHFSDATRTACDLSPVGSADQDPLSQSLDQSENESDEEHQQHGVEAVDPLSTARAASQSDQPTARAVSASSRAAEALQFARSFRATRGNSLRNPGSTLSAIAQAGTAVVANAL